MGWAGHIIGGLGHPSGKKRTGGVGAGNQVGSLVLSPVLIQWKGKKLQDGKDLWIVLVPFFFGTLSFGVQGLSSQRQGTWGKPGSWTVP